MPTLVAGLVIIAIMLSAVFFSATYTALTYCVENSQRNPPVMSFSDITLCSPANFYPHFLAFSVGIWLVVFGLTSRSAKPVLTSKIFIYSSLAAGIFFFGVTALMLTNSLQGETSFTYVIPWIFYVVPSNPFIIPLTGAGLILLSISGVVLKNSSNPARILMWVLVFVVIALVAGRLASDYVITLGSVAGVVAAFFVLRKRPIAPQIVAGVIVASVVVIVITQSQEVEGYPPDLHPDVTFLNQKIETLDGTDLVKTTNSSRTLGPDCILDSECVEKYGEGLMELSIHEGFQEDNEYNVVATMTNNGINVINITSLDIRGVILNDNGMPQHIEVQAIRDPLFGVMLGYLSFLQQREDIPKGSMFGPVAIEPGESLSAYIKGKWKPYPINDIAESQGSPLSSFQSETRYEYTILPFTRALGDGGSCLEYCSNGSHGTYALTNLHRGFWTLNAGVNVRAISPYGPTSEVIGPFDLPAHFSYAGCMSENDASDLYARRNFTLSYPKHVPSGFSLLCISDQNGSPSLAMIYANGSSAGIRDYVEDDPRLIYATSAQEPGSLIVTMTMATYSSGMQDFNQTAYREYERLKQHVEQSEELSSIDHVSIRNVPGGSIFVEGFDGGSSAVDLNLQDRKYHIFGRGVPEAELVRVAESL